jgi:putative zinc finger protein
MKCDKAQEFFSDYIENALDQPMVVALETHLNGCEACSADVSSLRDMWTVLDKVPQVEPPADFVWRTTTRLQNELLNRREAERARPLPWWKRLTPVQAFSYVGIAALLLIGVVVPVGNKLNYGTWGIGWPFGPHQVVQTAPAPNVTAPEFTAQVPGLNGAAATVTIQATSEMPYASVAMGYLTPSGTDLVTQLRPYTKPQTMEAGQSISVPVQVSGPQSDHAAKINLNTNGIAFSKVLILPGAPVVNDKLQDADAYFVLQQIAARTGQPMLVDGGLTPRVTLDLQSITPDQALQSLMTQVGAQSAKETTGVIDITKK